MQRTRNGKNHPNPPRLGRGKTAERGKSLAGRGHLPGLGLCLCTPLCPHPEPQIPRPLSHLPCERRGLPSPQWGRHPPKCGYSPGLGGGVEVLLFLSLLTAQIFGGGGTMGGSADVTMIPCEGTEHPPVPQPGFPAAPLPAAPQSTREEGKKGTVFLYFPLPRENSIRYPPPRPGFRPLP